MHKCVLVGYSRHKKKTTFIGGMELVSLHCNRDFTSASSYGLGWYKYAIATQWYQFHTTDAWWFSLMTNGVPLGPKNSKNRKKLPCPKIRILTTPQSSIWAKNRIYGYGAKSQHETPRILLGANRFPLGPKIGQNRKKMPCPKIRIFDYSAVIDLGKKSNLRLWRQITLGNPWGPSWGQWGALGAKKWVKTVKNYHAPKFVFWLLRGHQFGQKIEFTVMAPNHSRKPLGSILGPLGSHWGKKIGQSRKKLPCPKIRIFDYSAVIDLGKKSNLRLWRQITVGTP